jgi:hypothetical protein
MLNMLEQEPPEADASGYGSGSISDNASAIKLCLSFRVRLLFLASKFYFFESEM